MRKQFIKIVFDIFFYSAYNAPINRTVIQKAGVIITNPIINLYHNGKLGPCIHCDSNDCICDNE